MLAFVFSFMNALIYWDALTLLELPGNDDYMRYRQFLSWIENGNWYLVPDNDFNPQDGVVIHWSRLPDIPLALVYFVVQQYSTDAVAANLAMIAVPSLYLMGTLAAVGLCANKLSGKDASKLAMLMVLLSPLVTKYVPGAIDHHNLQLCLLAWTLALTPFSRVDGRNIKKAWLQGGLIALSLWVGVENLPLFAILMLILVLQGYYTYVHALKYANISCLSTALFSLLFTVINRPIDEFFLIRYDAISILVVVLFLSGTVYSFFSIVSFSRSKTRRVKKTARLVLLLFVFFPLIALYPFLLKGVFHEYPHLLQLYWLKHVTEAKPIIDYVASNGVLSEKNYLLFMIPALVSPFFIVGDRKYNANYIVFTLSLLLPLFWQSRMIYASFIFMVPVQAAFCSYMMNRYSNQMVRLVFMLVSMPLFLNVLMKMPTMFTTESSEPQVGAGGIKHKVNVLNDNRIERSLILAPISYGAPILALTNNRIISAPYHRNISGNTLVIEVFLSSDEDFITGAMKSHSVDYVMFGEDVGSAIFLIDSENDAFASRLDRGDIPDWLRLIEKDSHGVRLYKVDRGSL